MENYLSNLRQWLRLFWKNSEVYIISTISQCLFWCSTLYNLCWMRYFNLVSNLIGWKSHRQTTLICYLKLHIVTPCKDPMLPNLLWLYVLHLCGCMNLRCEAIHCPIFKSFKNVLQNLNMKRTHPVDFSDYLKLSSPV